MTGDIYPRLRMPARVSEAMRARGLSTRKAAALIGTSPATLHRVMHGHLPDVETFLRVVSWLTKERAL